MIFLKYFGSYSLFYIHKIFSYLHLKINIYVNSLCYEILIKGSSLVVLSVLFAVKTYKNIKIQIYIFNIFISVLSLKLKLQKFSIFFLVKNY